MPVPTDGIVAWGKGLEVDRAGSLPWLVDIEVHYWGDLDTHGFAILDRLRGLAPQTQSPNACASNWAQSRWPLRHMA